MVILAQMRGSLSVESRGRFRNLLLLLARTQRVIPFFASFHSPLAFFERLASPTEEESFLYLYWIGTLYILLERTEKEMAPNLIGIDRACPTCPGPSALRSALK